VEEILRQPSTEAVACVLLAVHGQVYSEDWEQKPEQEGWKTVLFSQTKNI
jgi:hypothetical protein